MTVAFNNNDDQESQDSEQISPQLSAQEATNPAYRSASLSHKKTQL